MRVRGDLAPSAAFTIEPQPKRPGFVLVRFYENVEPFSETTGEQTTSGFEYDEFYLELADTGDLQNDIYNNFDHFIEVAKLLTDSEKEEDGDAKFTQAERTEFLEGMMEGWGL